MSQTEPAESQERIGLKLTRAERTRLEALTGIPPKYATVIRESAKSKSVVPLTIEEWNDLWRYVVAESDQSLEMTDHLKLDDIALKIEDLVAAATDAQEVEEESPIDSGTSLGRQGKSFLQDAISTLTWVSMALGSAERFGVKNKPVENFPLDEAEREAVSKLVTYPLRLRNKLGKPQAKFTVEDTGRLLEVILNSFINPDRRRSDTGGGDSLIEPSMKLIDCLESEISAADAAIPRRKAKPTSRLFQLKITLDGIDPPIWRRIQTTDCTLSELHEVIQVVMGWENYHMHQFIINGVRYGAKEAIEHGLENEDEGKVRLNQIIPNQGKKKFRFQYDYDFGDDWVHEILFEESPEPESRAKYPRCIDGARSGPPEDIGGIWGYQELLDAVDDPDDERYDERLEWMGGWDAERFSVKEINKALRQLR